MKEKVVTIEDCFKLRKQFEEYCKSAEQNQFIWLFQADVFMQHTLSHIEEAIKDQNGIRSMFRCVYRLMGLDYSKYIDEAYLKNKELNKEGK